MFDVCHLNAGFEWLLKEYVGLFDQGLMRRGFAETSIQLCHQRRSSTCNYLVMSHEQKVSEQRLLA